MRAIGVIDGLEVIDPETGDAKWVEASGGLHFSFCDPVSPGARMRGRLAVRNGGMVVFETLGTMENITAHRGATAAAVVATDRALPSDEQARQELAAQHAARTPRRVQTPPTQPTPA